MDLLYNRSQLIHYTTVFVICHAIFFIVYNSVTHSPYIKSFLASSTEEFGPSRGIVCIFLKNFFQNPTTMAKNMV